MTEHILPRGHIPACKYNSNNTVSNIAKNITKALELELQKNSSTVDGDFAALVLLILCMLLLFAYIPSLQRQRMRQRMMHGRRNADNRLGQTLTGDNVFIAIPLS